MFFPYIKDFIQSLSTNDSIKRFVSKVVFNLTSSYPDLSDQVKISYFESNINGLAGFAGIKEVYMSLNELDNFFANITWKNLEKRTALSKLRTFCLIAHEMTHSVLKTSFNKIIHIKLF